MHSRWPDDIGGPDAWAAGAEVVDSGDFIPEGIIPGSEACPSSLPQTKPIQLVLDLAWPSRNLVPKQSCAPSSRFTLIRHLHTDLKSS